MSQQLAVVDVPRQTVQLSVDQVKYIANTELIPKDKRGNVPAIMAAIITARELGIGDMFGVNNINVIDGSVSYSAVLASYLIRRAGHSLTKEEGDGWVIAHGERRDNGDKISVRWDMEKAKTAGLGGPTRSGKPSAWDKYPKSMLWARAVTQLARELFADVFAGEIYSPEELGDERFTDYEVIDEPSDRSGTRTPEESLAAGAGEKAPQPDSPPHPPVYDHPIEPILDEADVVFMDTEPDPEPEQTEGATFGSGRHAGETVAQVWDEDPESEGHRYILWAVKSWKTGAIAKDLEAFAKEHGLA